MTNLETNIEILIKQHFQKVKCEINSDIEDGYILIEGEEADLIYIPANLSKGVYGNMAFYLKRKNQHGEEVYFKPKLPISVIPKMTPFLKRLGFCIE